jgi:hypothetical protein
MEAIMEVIVQMTASYPVLMTVLSVIGILRVINKPLFALLHAYVNVTETTKDNELLAKIEASSIYMGVAFILDWFGSVKLPAKAE